MTPRGRDLLLLGVSAVGYVMCAKLLLEHGIHSAGGLGAGDVFAYYTAGAHVLSGEPLYAAGVGGYAAYLYPPPLAQLFAPLSALPFPLVVWAWRGLLLGCLRVAVGSWRSAGIALLIWPPLVSELDAANVHLFLAAAVAEAIRGRASLLAPVTLTKFASVAAMPMALFHDRRGLLAGAGAAALVAVASFAIAPDLWLQYLEFGLTAPAPHPGWYNLGDQVPGWLRFGTAALAAVAAIRWRRLAAVAVTLALPVLWLHGLSTLVAIVARPGRAGDRAASADGAQGNSPTADGVPVTP